MATFTEELRRLVMGDPFGSVFPPRPDPPPMPKDGRTYALEVLRKYLAAQTYYRPGGKGERPISFRIPEDRIIIDVADYNADLLMPNMVFLAAPKADYATLGLTAFLEEGSFDKFQRGTVLQYQSEYTETFSLELWTSSKAELRGVLAVLEAALTPTEQMYGIRFRVPSYYDQLVCFTLNSREQFNDGDMAKNRRRVALSIEMRFNIVALVNAETFKPATDVLVDEDPATGFQVVTEVPDDDGG